MKYTAFFVIIILFVGCSKDGKKKSSVNEMPSQEVINAINTDSHLTFPIDFPAEDIARLLNKVMPPVLVDDTLKLNEKGDYIKLLIEPQGKTYVSAYANNLDSSIPLKVSAYVNKKVFGVNVGNKEPLVFILRADINTKLDLDEDWYLDGKCTIQKIRWIKTPQLEFMGFKIDLEKIITKQLEDNSDKIGGVICGAIRNVVPIRQQVLKVWDLLNKTHKIVKEPVPIWLSAAPVAFNASFSKDTKDTVRLMLDVQSNIFITPVKGLSSDAGSLPKNRPEIASSEEKLDIKVVVKLPFKDVDKVLNDLVGKKEISYEGVDVQISDFETSAESQRLRLDFKLKGDIKSKLAVMASPTLNANHDLELQNIAYDVSNNRLMEAINELARDEIMEFLLSKSKIPLGRILDSLDYKIMGAMNKSDVGNKIALDMNFTSIETDTLFYFEDHLEWYFDVKGKAHTYLNEHIAD